MQWKLWKNYQVEVVLCDLKEDSIFVVEEKRFNMNISNLFLIVGTTDWIKKPWLLNRLESSILTIYPRSQRRLHQWSLSNLLIHLINSQGQNLQFVHPPHRSHQQLWPHRICILTFHPCPLWEESLYCINSAAHPSGWGRGGVVL